MSPYKLVFGKACYLPIKLEYLTIWAIKQLNFDLDIAGEHRKLQSNELEEIRNDAYENAKIYKEKTNVFYDKIILQKSFTASQKSLIV